MNEFEKALNKETDPDSKLTLEERKALQAKAMDEATISAVANPKNLQTYLEILSRFERYSTRNTLLIYAKRPDATRIMDMNGWNKVGKRVKKGAKGITIYEPQKVVKDGKTFTNFVHKSMFDITDIQDADPYVPERYPVDQLLRALFEGKTVDVEVLQNYPSSEPHGAFYDTEDDVVYVKPGMDNETILAAVAYGLAHADMAADSEDYIPGEHIFEAECAAYALCRKHGISADSVLPEVIPEGFRTMTPDDIRKHLDEGHNAMKHLCSMVYRSLGKTKETAKAGTPAGQSVNPGAKNTRNRGGDAR